MAIAGVLRLSHISKLSISILHAVSRVDGSFIGQEGMQAIADALPLAHKLAKLDLSDTRIYIICRQHTDESHGREGGFRGPAMQPNDSRAQSWYRLSSFIGATDSNMIEDEGAKAIADTLKQNRTLAYLSLGTKKCFMR